MACKTCEGCQGKKKATTRVRVWGRGGWQYVTGKCPMCKGKGHRFVRGHRAWW